MTVDFLPERITIKRASRARLVRQGYLLGIVFTSLVSLGYFNEERVAYAEAQMSDLATQSANRTRQVEMMYDLQKQLSDLMIKQQIDNRLGSRINAMDILGELGQILPESTTLTSLELSAKPVGLDIKRAARGVPSAAGPRRAGKKRTKVVNRLKLTITGLSPNNVDVANFIASLSASPFFEEVVMGYAKNIVFRKKAAKEFRASCYVVR
ncbi:MAG: PilN domain-containing protein [Phycisphaerae bacterium]|jgi:Tfp pilus assembly protein PilN|nr:PilN domain-containing protein [Phycisphaerae bacterium]